MSRQLIRAVGLILGALLVAGACSSSASPATTSAAGGATSAGPAASGGAMASLVAAAKQEGTLNVIALPHDWCNYGAVISGFKAQYGLSVNELNPNAGSGDEIQAIIANKSNKGPQAPDVIDVGLSFGPQAISQGLITPYKVSTWSSIPDSAKDANGYWYGDYYGVLAFEVNGAIVKNPPQDWSDLLKPEYKGQVALAGDPRVSAQAIDTVYAAALANGGSLDNAAPGLQFFKQLNQEGNFVPVIAKPGTIDQGATPITIRWTYNALSHRDAANGNPPIDVVVPKTGRLAGVYVQAISAYAPHPNAAKLWEEYLYSDAGQLLWLQGYCNPIRYQDLTQRNVVPSALAAKLPDTAGAVFPTLDQLDTAAGIITKQWDAVVGANVK